MVFKIDNNIVFGTAFIVPPQDPTIVDIFGSPISLYSAMNECDKNRNRDGLIITVNDMIHRNMELGVEIVALWREYMISRPSTGKALEQLSNFSSILLALASGCLKEAALLIENMTEDSDITSEIKAKFASACRSADHIK